MAKKQDKEYDIEERFARRIFEVMTLSAYQRGEITDDDLKDIEALGLKHLKRLKNRQLQFVIDFSGEIKKYAKLFYDKKEYEYAILFYALYFEHTMNNIIDTVLSRGKFPKKPINEILRSVGIQGKISWLPQLIGLSPINSKHTKIIQRVSEERNSFVHYKWNSGARDESSEKKLKALLANAKKTAEYISQYRSRVLYKNKKSAIMKLLRHPKKQEAK